VLLCSSYSNSQNLDPVTGTEIYSTGNVLNLGGGLPWTNTVTGQAGGVSGGDVPAYNSGTGNIIFGYNQATVSQSIAINTALANAGLGIQLSGYKYAWQINNDLLNGGGNRGTLTANVSLTGATGNVLESFNYDYNQNYPGFTLFSGTQFFNNRYTTSQASNLTVSFTGKDQNWWAGYYGPRVHVDDVSLLYTIDPCKLNPAYSSTCVGFNNVVNTNNLLDSTQGGLSLNQAFAINTALSNAGVGAMVHGFNYGFNWRVGQGFSGCTATNQDGSCSWYMNIPAYANASVSLTNSSNQIIEQKNYSFSGEGTSGSVSDKYLLPSSMNQSLLGTGRIVGSASGTNSSVEGAWATMIYTADPCVANPLYSSNCKGYAFAMSKQLSASNKMAGSNSALSIDPTTGEQSDPAQPPPGPGGPPSAGGPPPPQGSEPPPGSQPPPGSSPPPGATQTVSSNPSANPPPSQPPSQGSSSQPRAGEVKTAVDSNKSSSSGSTVSLSSVLSMISSNQARIGNEAKAVVQAAEAQAAQTATAAQQQAESVAASAVTQSMSSSSTGTSASLGTTARTITQTQTSAFSLPTGQTATASSIEAIRPPAQADTAETAQNAGTGLSVTAPTSQYSLFAAPAASVFSSVELPVTNFGFQLPTGRTIIQSEPESTFQPEGIKIGGRSALNDAIEQRPLLPNTTPQEQKTDAVNKNAQPNEVAGRVDIASMATQPQGYQAYSAIMPDVAFYAPREIYRNQRTVDNARALRQLSSDRLHQDLVNLQYK
jgi:hypothetical protein